VFCAGANIRMLGQATHGHRVNFCKFTNETRLAIEDATENSGQIYLAAISGTAPNGTVGTAYSFTYTATGTPTPTFNVSGGALPAGLSLRSQ